MYSQQVVFFIATICLLVGGLLCWFAVRRRQAPTTPDGQENALQGLQTAQIELAAANERASRLPQLETDLADAIRSLNESNARKASLETETRRIPELNAKVLELEKVIAETASQTADLREQSGRMNAELNAEREQLSLMRTELEAVRASDAELRTQLSTRTAELTEARTSLDHERRTGQEKLSLLMDAKQALADQFKTLANEILEDKSKRFTEQNLAGLGKILEPLGSKITEFKSKVEDVYIKEGKDRSALAEQVRQLMDLNRVLSDDAKSLTRALKGSSKTQGNWGELILERVLEASGLRKGEEYVVQGSFTRDDGTRALPDVIIRLPEDRNLIIDAKISLTAYEEFAASEDESERVACHRRHLESVRAHIKGLSERSYQSLYGLNSLDFVLMFIPIEPAFMLAISGDQNLFMDAWKKNVLLVSPSTLLFVVRTVAHLWRQEAQTRNAQEIASRGAELYDKFSGFVEDMTSLGTRLGQAQREYDQAYKKLFEGRGNLIRQAEMLRELGVKPTKSLPANLAERSTDNVRIPSDVDQPTLREDDQASTGVSDDDPLD